MEARPAHAASDAAFRDRIRSGGAIPSSVSGRVGDRRAGLRRRGRGALRHILVVQADHASSRGVLRPQAFTPRRSTSSTTCATSSGYPTTTPICYAQHFPRPPDAGQTGEWTPRYMLDPWVMRQLRQVAPAARILLLLRDPVARYASAYARTMRQERRAGGSHLPERVVEGEVSRGFYLRQVRRVLDAFPRESVLILQYERCCLDYEGQLDRTWEFLGVEPGFRPPSSARNVPRAQGHHGFLHNRRGREARRGLRRGFGSAGRDRAGDRPLAVAERGRPGLIGRVLSATVATSEPRCTSDGPRRIVRENGIPSSTTKPPTRNALP